MEPEHRHNKERSQKNLKLALKLVSTFMFAEFIGGILTNSLALLADAGHMLTDSVALSLSLLALRFSSRPATAKKTYGYFRIEILAALLNGVVLVLIALFIFYEAYRRVWNPQPVHSLPMLIIAGSGLVINLICAHLLSKSSVDNLTIKSAFFHILGDAIGSIGALLAGVIMLIWKWYAADPIIGFIVGLLILYSAWRLLKDSVDVLLEGTPSHINVEAMKEVFGSIQGVDSVHDLHVWTLTSGMHAMSCHVVVQGAIKRRDILKEINHLCREQFQIEHTTIQLEEEDLRSKELKTCH